MISSFQFRSYKVDAFSYTMAQNLDLLSLADAIPDDVFEIKFAIRQPMYFKSRKEYVGGLECELKCFSKTDAPEHEKVELFTVTCGIAGIFCSTSELDQDVEERLVRVQIPSILFPYLRGTITTFLACAGFAGVVLPLVNVYEMAKSLTNDFQIKVVD